MNYRILVASYSDEIVTLDFNPKAGTLSTVASLTVGKAPSWITRHTSDTSIYFAALERAEGAVVVLKYNDDGVGQVIAEIPSLGADPCYLLMIKENILVSNYSSMTVVSMPVSASSPYLTSAKIELEFRGSGPVQERQLCSHPHQVFEQPDHGEVLVPDLGCDKTWRIAKNEEGSWEVRGFVQYVAGSGPRHVALYGDVLYTLAELSNYVFAHKLPPLPSEPTFLASSPMMTNPPPSPNNMFAAEIFIPTPNARYPAPYLYASNRNDPSPEGDSIAIFSIADDKLELVNEVHTGLKHLRGFAFGGPNSEWLIAGGVRGSGVKVFERVDGGTGLKEIASESTINAPAGFAWM